MYTHTYINLSSVWLALSVCLSFVFLCFVFTRTANLFGPPHLLIGPRTAGLRAELQDERRRRVFSRESSRAMLLLFSFYGFTNRHVVFAAGRWVCSQRHRR